MCNMDCLNCKYADCINDSKPTFNEIKEIEDRDSNDGTLEEKAKKKKEKMREYYLNRKERKLEYSRKYQAKNKEIIRQKKKEYYQKNKEKFKAYQKEYYEKKRRKNDSTLSEL